MKIVSIITDKTVILKIMKHLGLWTERPYRGPPQEINNQIPNQIEYIPDDGGWPEPEYS